jgi:hypothetical protein
LINDLRRRPRLDSLGLAYQFEYWPSDERFYFWGHPYTVFPFTVGLSISVRPSAEIAQKEDVVDKRKTRDKSAEPLAGING